MFLLESHLSQRGFQVEGLNDAQETQLFHIIVLSTEGAATDVLMEVKDKKATSALKLLKARYAPQTQDRMVSLQERLFERDWRDADTVVTFASDIRISRHSLAQIGKHAVIPNAAIRSLVISKISRIPIFASTAAQARAEDIKIPEDADDDKINTTYGEKLDALFEHMKSAESTAKYMDKPDARHAMAAAASTYRPSGKPSVVTFATRPATLRHSAVKRSAPRRRAM